jgi:hypothetical protein
LCLVSSCVPSGSRSWRSPPSTLLRVPPMEVERFKHRQLAPTVGPSSRSPANSKDLICEINLARCISMATHRVRASCLEPKVKSKPQRATVRDRSPAMQLEFHRISNRQLVKPDAESVLSKLLFKTEFESNSPNIQQTAACPTPTLQHVLACKTEAQRQLCYL